MTFGPYINPRRWWSSYVLHLINEEAESWLAQIHTVKLGINGFGPQGFWPLFLCSTYHFGLWDCPWHLIKMLCFYFFKMRIMALTWRLVGIVVWIAEIGNSSEFVLRKKKSKKESVFLYVLTNLITIFDIGFI